MHTSYINNRRHLARKYAGIFVRRHYLFREANSFPRAKPEENCELWGTDNVQGQISEHIFTPNGDYCLYYPSNLFRNMRSFKNWGIFNNWIAWCKKGISDFFRWNFFSFKSAWIFACAFQLSRKTFSCIVFLAEMLLFCFVVVIVHAWIFCLCFSQKQSANQVKK